jgi:hypothetical protein
MACEFDQADFGAPFAEMDEEDFDVYLNQAIEIFYGACATKVDTQWANCCLNPCAAIKLLTKHLILADPNSGIGSAEAESESVGDVSVTYASTSASATEHGNTLWGREYDKMIGDFQRCRAKRSHGPLAVRGTRCATC